MKMKTTTLRMTSRLFMRTTRQVKKNQNHKCDDLRVSADRQIACNQQQCMETHMETRHKFK